MSRQCVVPPRLRQLPPAGLIAAHAGLPPLQGLVKAEPQGLAALSESQYTTAVFIIMELACFPARIAGLPGVAGGVRERLPGSNHCI